MESPRSPEDTQPAPKPGRRSSHQYGPAPAYGPATYGYGGYGGGGGGGYGGYGGQGGYPGDPSGHMVQRTLQDYLLILRERFWYILATFIVVLASAGIYTFSLTPLYQATSTVVIFRRAATVMATQQVMDNDIRSAEDLNTQVNQLKTLTLVNRVAERIKGPDLERFLAPYRDPKTGAVPQVAGVLAGNRTITPVRLSLNINIQYRHPDPQVAAQVADLFADEYIAYNASLKVDDTVKAVNELKVRADEARKEVDGLARRLQDYRERNNMVSLDQRKDISTEALKELSNRVTQATAALQEAEGRWKQVEEAKKTGRMEDLLRLPVIAADPAVAQLYGEIATRNIARKELEQTYRAGNPVMIEATRALAEAERQLSLAVDKATAQVNATFQNAALNLTQARDALTAQERSSLAMDREAVGYNELEREYRITESNLQGLLKRMQETEATATSGVETQNARISDRAVVPRGPILPNKKLNLALGALGGLALGVALAFFVAYLDDRIKSAYDIEGVVGLPLLAIVPKFKNAEQTNEKGPQAFAALKEPEIAEAFSTLYSSLRLKDEAKDAKCIVVTSTIPGEGKSFISRNLAMTFASHGEKVLLVDCDLRRPVAHRPFQVENTKGVIDVIDIDTQPDGALIDSAIVKNVQPGLDLMPSGGRSKNPAQLLTSHNFEILLAELRKRYDRIFIDTPPVALVSDALVILPLADGSIYSIFFNKVRRKAAQFCVQRLLEINIPTFGAVLNGLDQNIGGYYYHHYYDKKYKDYYAAADDASARGGKRRERRGAADAAP